MTYLSPELINRFREAVAELDVVFADRKLDDDSVEDELRLWLDGDAKPLPWACANRVTPDEWFFISTLYGQLTLNGQRTHIRKYFPLLFVEAAKRDIRNFVSGMAEFAGLRSPWMSKRLCRMGEILRQRSLTMAEYTDELRQLERSSTPTNPMPALDEIIRDHRTSEGKTLSVFVRACVGGNCFPIDSRVRSELTRYNLPDDERSMVCLALMVDRNPRQVARMFYEAEWQRA
jgi:hypothetical protein